MVIDSGLARVPRYEPDVGLTRLETVRVSRAAADQRRGRAGRTEPGVCYRLWDEPQTGSLEPYTRPEILSADLSSFVLDLAQWGASDPGKLAFLDPPPQAALNEAKDLLRELGAIDAQGRITDEGKQAAAAAAAAAARAHGGRCRARRRRRAGGGDCRGADRARARRRRRRSAPSARSVPPRPSRRAEEARAMVKRWSETAGGKETGSGESVGSLLALAYPDRIAKSRGGGNGAFLLANGRGGTVDPASPLAREPFLAVAELTGAAAASRIILAAPITLAEIEARFGDKIEDRETVTFDAASASLRARRSRRLGALVLAEQIKPVEPDADSAQAAGRRYRGARHPQIAMEQAATSIAQPRAIPAQSGRR